MPASHPVPSYSPDSSVMSRGWITRFWQQEETIRRAVILTVLYLIPAMWILNPVVFDPDIWWHLQSGKWIVEHRAFPATDPFSAYGEGQPWVAYSWLFEIGMYGVIQVFGETGIILCTLVGVWLTVLMLHRIIATRNPNFLLVCGLMTASILALSRLCTPRPWLLTILFFAITLEVVLLLREGRQYRWFWLLPAIYVIWANVHIQFVYGLALLGLACVAPLIDRFGEPVIGTRSPMPWGSPQCKKLIGLTAVCAVATLISPYHVRLYSLAVELSAQTGMWEYTQEMQALPFRSISDWAMLGLFAAALIRLGRAKTWSSFEILFLLMATFSAFRGQRDVWFLVMATVVVLTPKRIDEERDPSTIVSRDGLAVVILLMTVGVVFIIGYREFSPERIQENTAKIYPIEAASFVEQQGYAGPLYNHFDWGGYLIWRLPHLKVSMDGRANVHGDERIKKANATWAGGHHWGDDPDLNKANVVIAKKDMALASLLRLDPRFHSTYQDETAVVFLRAPRNERQSNFPTGNSPFPSSPAFVVAQ
jgi:hypothetical protein